MRDKLNINSKGRNFYISDLHIGHKAIRRLDNRPFSSDEEMNTAIIENWNSTVEDNDTVYILGDYCFKADQGYNVLKQLKGHKVLILGNHDRLNDNSKELFDLIENQKEIVDTIEAETRRVILSHYPIASFNKMFRGAIHLYGHVHNNPDYDVIKDYYTMASEKLGIEIQAYNCGCMLGYMSYTPRTLIEIIRSNVV